MPPVHELSLEHMPFMNLQLPGGAGCKHSESSGRWFIGTRMTPLDDPLAEPPLEEPLDDPLDEPLEEPLELPLPLPEPPLELPELDDPPSVPPSPPLKVVPPQAHNATAADPTSQHSSRRMFDLLLAQPAYPHSPCTWHSQRPVAMPYAHTAGPCDEEQSVSSTQRSFDVWQ
jgi:hypothetical protein